MNSDINIHLETLLNEMGLSSNDTGGKVIFNGEDPIYNSVYRMGAMSAIPPMACAVGVATIWRLRTGQSQDLSIDLRKSIHNINPEYKFGPTINGFPYSKSVQKGNPVIGNLYLTRDDRWVIPSGVYQPLMLKWLNFLKCQPNVDSVATAIRQWNAQELEDEAATEKLPVSICRTSEEWLQHLAGQHLSNKPVIEIEKIGESEPKPFGLSPRPLSDIRVLAPVHAIAGPTVVRTLTEHGADALQITTPDEYEHDNIYNDANIGIRSTWLNLKVGEQNKRAHELAKEADIFVENYRNSAMKNFGFTPQELSELNPGIVYVSLRCYGYDGPWGERGGFDFQGSAASGLTTIEGTPEQPKMPVTWMINDYITGYLGAAGAIAALIKRAKEGGSYHVKVSLTRSAMWYLSLGLFDRNNLDFQGEQHQVLAPEIITRNTPLGELSRLAPAVTFAKTPGYWEDPILVPRGSNKPLWLIR